MSQRTNSSVLVMGLKQGDELAAEQLVEEYLAPLCRIARQSLTHSNCRAVDENDVVQSVLIRFLSRVKNQAFPALNDRQGVFNILRRMTRDKVIDLIRKNRSRRRGSGNLRGSSAIRDSDSSAIQTHQPNPLTPDQALAIQDEMESMLAELADAELSEIAMQKMAGYTNQEISVRLDCSLRTVERRINLIKQIWSRTNDQAQDAEN